MLRYAVHASGAGLPIEDVLAVYRESTLGLRRPLDDLARMRQMMEQANLVVTAHDGDQMVGLARSLSDYCYATYLSCLAVRSSHQRQGIGKELIRRTQQASLPATVILLAAPQAVDYYPHIGMSAHPSCWVLKPDEALR